ncbi:HlyC/CorC family transporter [Parvularcula dongshanensis]|uniref:Mg2+/Co2+ transporter CorB n=1 Tax=Parvularcula dongshanensis TaxID=1173995 RepID=A0A840I4U5_9PROT|nr:HlyC/CorC family transporter [Parvularcula dongshanensis]MBB4659355.1 Mg2+/Co2+ transporter CorB [Parvularcula dongshanensis]
MSVLLFVLLLLAMSAFFSGSETALTATSRARMRSMEEKGVKSAGAVIRLTENKERLIGAILLGNNLVNILASALTTSVFAAMFPGGAGVAIATAVMTVLVLVFSEVAPKTAAIARPDPFAMAVARPMAFLVRLLAPITGVIQFIVRSTLRLFGLDVSAQAQVLSATEELIGAVELHHEEGAMDKHARDLLRGALELDEISVEEIMRHRKNIEMLDADKPVLEIVEAVLASNHTRIPLYAEEPDNVVGVLHAKDLLRAIWANGNKVDGLDVTAIAMPPYFVPETTTLQEQLDAFKANQQHFALVVDEYGSIQGLVTLEDILEEIVGEIEDEYDAPVVGVRKQPDGSVVVDGDVTIRDLNRTLDWRLPDEEAVTIAGLVIHEARTIPDIGQVFSFFGFRFEVLKKRRNQVTSLRIAPVVEPA